MRFFICLVLLISPNFVSYAQEAPDGNVELSEDFDIDHFERLVSSLVVGQLVKDHSFDQLYKCDLILDELDRSGAIDFIEHKNGLVDSFGRASVIRTILDGGSFNAIRDSFSERLWLQYSNAPEPTKAIFLDFKLCDSIHASAKDVVMANFMADEQ